MPIVSLSSDDSAKEKAGEEKKKEEQEKLSTSKPAVVAIPDDNTVMQVACGAFHTSRSHDGHMIVM